ncbi:MAG: DUF4270 family protein [Flavobacteriales bacterium]|nr:DUF4270 family protein [Flavobacteriales bacterium]
MIRPLLGVVLIMAFIGACKKKEDPFIGIEVQPENNQLGLLTTDTFIIQCVTLKLDSSRADNSKLGVIGSYQDPVFGLTKTATALQYRLASENTEIDALKNHRIDSAVLTLVYSGYYGTLEKQSFGVYEITEDLNSTRKYPTSYNLSVSSNPIGRITDFTPDFKSIPVIYDTPERPEIRIRLDSSFARKLVDVDPSVYRTNENFLANFKGFLIQAENTSQASRTGAQLMFNLLDEYTRLTLYFTENGGPRGKLDYLINDKSVRFILNQNDYTSSEVERAFGDQSIGDQKIYIQSLAGTYVKIQTPDISRIARNGPVIINKAELELPISSDATATYQPIGQLFAFREDETGKLYDTPDKGELHYDGKFNTTTNSYHIGLTRYFQQILTGKVSNNVLVLRELGESYGRSELSGPKASTKPMKLVVTYTPTY